MDATTTGNTAVWLVPGPPCAEWLSVTIEAPELPPGTYGTPRGTLTVTRH